MQFKIKHNFKEEIKAVEKLKSEIKKAAFSGVDKAATASLVELKSKLRTEVRTLGAAPKSPYDTQTAPVTDKPVMPKFKEDLIKTLFGKDYQELKMTKTPNKNIFPTTFGSGFYVTWNGRFEVKVPMQHGLTANDYMRMVKNSFEDAIFIDPSTGEAYQLDPQFIDGLKLKCSHKGRSDDERLDAAINNGQTEIVVTAYKQNFKTAVDKAIPIGPVTDAILEADYNKAQDILRKYSHSAAASKAIEKIEQLKAGNVEELPKEVTSLNNTIKLIQNIKIRKIVKNETNVEYALVSGYSADGKDFENLESKLESEISLWLLGIQENLVQAIIREVTNAIEQYGRSK